MTASVAFIGLGTMGYPMAGFLQRKGYQVTVFNRTMSKAKAWVEEYGGRQAATPREAATGAQFVLSCVGNDNDVREIALGPDGVFSCMPPGAIFVDHTTTSAQLAKELAAGATERGSHFLDAPVSGGQAGAENGRLTVMAGGDNDIFEKALPVLQCYSHSAKLLGPVGSGQLCKMVNQICIAGLVQGLAEGIHFAENAGLDVEQVVEVISKGAAQSWQMDNRHKTMIKGEYNHGFAVDWMRKDLSIVLQEARANGATLPVTALVDQFYAEVQALGGGRWDTSSLLARLKK